LLLPKDKRALAWANAIPSEIVSKSVKTTSALDQCVAVRCSNRKKKLALMSYSVAYRASMVALVIGLGYGIVRVYRSSQDPPLERRRDAFIALGRSALLLIGRSYVLGQPAIDCLHESGHVPECDDE
jgi:hypothetical protein